MISNIILNIFSCSKNEKLEDNPYARGIRYQLRTDTRIKATLRNIDSYRGNFRR